MVSILELLGFKKKERIVVNYNSSELNDGEKLQSVFNENAYLKGIIARANSEKSQKSEKDKEQEKEQEKIKYLNEEEKSLKKNELNPFSLFSLFEYVKKSRKNPEKFKPIKFTTFDGSKILGNVDNIAIMPDGGLGVFADGDLIWASRDINHIFWWVAGLNNFSKNKIIPLCINSRGTYEPNLQTEELSELVKMSDGRFKINRFNKKPLYEHVSDLHNQIGELQGELEVEEETISEQQKEIKEKDREVKLHRTRADKAESGLSDALNKVSEIEGATGEIIRQNMALMNIKEINETLIETMNNVVEKWSGKIEDKFGKDIREAEWEELKSKLNWAKANMPQTIYQMPEKEEKPTLFDQVRPGKV